MTRPAWDEEIGEEYEEEVTDMCVIELPCAGRSALSLCFALMRQMSNENYKARSEWREDLMEIEYSSAWLESETVLKELIKLFKATLHAKRPPSKVAVHEGVVSMWETFRADAASHDARLLCRGGEAVTAHAQMLALASPALAAMLASSLVEGATKSIAIEDCGAASARFFLDLLYTGSSEADLDGEAAASTLLEALALAHRWQVPAVVEMTERALTRAIGTRSFDEIATAAQQMALSGLKRACKQYAVDPENGIQRRLEAALRGGADASDDGKLPQAVVDLLAPPAAGMGSDQPAAKKRRSY